MNKLSTGAVLNPVDYRDIPATADISPLPNVSSISKYRYEKIDLFPVLNQGGIGSCVGHAESLVKSIMDYEETSNVEILSPAYLYGLCKAIDNNPNQGTFPRIAGKALLDRGVCSLALYPSNINLSVEQYTAFNPTIQQEADAKKHVIKSYGFCPADLEMLLATVYQKKALGITLVCNNPNAWYATQIIPAPQGNILGLHRVAVIGWERINGRVLIECRNSWSENAHLQGRGNFKFYWDEYRNAIFDIMPYIDAPNNVIEDAKNKDNVFVYTWYKNLSVTTNNPSNKTDILALQKALTITGDFYNKVKGDQIATGFYSEVTKQSVIRYQARKGIMQTGIFGMLTRASLNAEFSKKKV